MNIPDELLENLENLTGDEIKLYLYLLTRNARISVDEIEKEFNWEYETIAAYLADLTSLNLVFPIMKHLTYMAVSVHPELNDDLIEEMSEDVGSPFFLLCNGIREVTKRQLLTRSELRVLYELFHVNGIPAEIIIYAAAYMTAKDICEYKYLKTLVYNWYYKEQLTYFEAVKIRHHIPENNALRTVLSPYGLGEHENEYIDRWTKMGATEKDIREAYSLAKERGDKYVNLPYINGIVKNIVEKEKRTQISPKKEMTINDYREIKSIVYAVVTNRYEENLSQLAVVRYGQKVIMFAYRLDGMECFVKNLDLARWNISTEQIYSDAQDNICKH